MALQCFPRCNSRLTKPILADPSADCRILWRWSGQSSVANGPVQFLAEPDLEMAMTFFRDRGPSLALVMLIMLAISLGQTGISYTMAFGALRALLPRDRSGVATSLVILRFGLVALMAVLWALRRKHALFQLIIIANALFTIALLIQTSS